MNSITKPGLLLRLEGFVVLVLTMVVYWRIESNWLLFVLLFLGPDMAMLGYLANPQVGSSIYNLAHTYIWPIALALFAWLSSAPLALSLALIWIAHIGLDRGLGFGLKYPTEFKDTHLSCV